MLTGSPARLGPHPSSIRFAGSLREDRMRTSRREFIALALVSALPGASTAQSKPRVIGLLWNDSVKPSPHVATLLGALRELGWSIGRNLEVEDRIALEGHAPMPASAEALVQRRCDVIVCYGATATIAAAKATKEIPIATLIGVDPVRAKLVASLPRPGGNVTGVWNISQGLIVKRLELLRELVPGLRDAGFLVQGTSAAEGREQSIGEAEAAAAKLNLTLHRTIVNSTGEIDTAIAGFAKAGLRGVYISQGTVLAAHSERVVRAVATHKLVAVYPLDRFAEAGGLLSYSPSAKKAFVRLAAYVDRLLKGAKAADTPIEQLADVELVVNLKTAKAFGVKIPQSIVHRADRVIE